MTSSPRPEQAPTLHVGGYRLLARLGEGGMGVVHLARRGDGPRVALKVLRPHIVGDEEARQRLDREVHSLSLVRSRWVAEIVDADPWGEIPYVATRYVPGLSLHELVQEEGPLAGDDLRWLADCLAEGVSSVHAVGVLHRDVKPSNVLMEGRTPILIDFGLARVADDPRLTHTGWLLGTPGYLAPEILYGDDATTASDVHSWAATVALAGTGRPPFGRGPSMAVMDRVRRGQHDLTGLPRDVAEVVEPALDPDPRRRPTFDQVRDALGGGPMPVMATPVPHVDDVDDDPYTAPLALAAAGRQPTISLFEDDDDEDLPGSTRYLDELPPAARTPLAERLRRGLLLGALGLCLASALTAAPWPTLALVSVVVWLLRSGSLAASAAGARRTVRGHRWYDAPQLLLASPWHVVQAIPGALLLLLWSLGLALACGLVGYAFAASMQATLFACGVVLACSLWWGPGGSRLSGPVNRVVRPLSRSLVRWLVASLLVLAAGIGVGALATQQGTDWAPLGSPMSWLV